MNVIDLQKMVLAGARPLLLDLFPNASAAYSLRKLNTAYTGNCIEVRRSSDNTTQNIGFVNGILDTASLLSFVGAGNGFVRTWYDQSGNGRNVSNTTNANQPQIVNAGSLINVNLKSSIKFDGSNDYLINSVGFLNNASDVYSSVVFSTTSTVSIQIVHSNPSGIGGNRGYDLRIPNANQIQLAIFTNPSFTASNAIGNFNYSTGNYNLITGTFNAQLATNEHKIYANSTLVHAVSNSGTSILNDGNNGGFLIGYFGIPNTFGTYLNGNVGELIFYTTDQSANRTTIESNINSYYNIF